MTSKGNKGLVILLTLAIVFLFSFIFLEPKFGPQVELSFTNRGGDKAVSDNGDDLGGAVDVEVENRSKAIDLAIADLGSSESVDIEDISVEDVSFEEFSDSSLGCSVEGEVYAQVVTPGYTVNLKVGDTLYDYRVSSDLQTVKFCK